MFQEKKTLRAGQLIIFRQLGSADEPFSKYEKNYQKLLHFRRRNVRNGDNTNMFLKGYPLEAKTAPKNWN